jgi:hypothetical protein
MKNARDSFSFLLLLIIYINNASVNIGLASDEAVTFWASLPSIRYIFILVLLRHSFRLINPSLFSFPHPYILPTNY